jgi:hypothetical protein
MIQPHRILHQFTCEKALPRNQQKSISELAILPRYLSGYHPVQDVRPCCSAKRNGV